MNSLNLTNLFKFRVCRKIWKHYLGYWISWWWRENYFLDQRRIKND